VRTGLQSACHVQSLLTTRARYRHLLPPHRGTRDRIAWFSNPTSIARSLTAISILSSEFTSSTSSSTYGNTVIAIELVNEPFPQDSASLDVLQRYYEAGYGVVRGTNGNTVVAIGDAFEGLGAWLDFMPATTHSRVMMDTVRRGEASAKAWAC
jgi:glucan 1,3-beta-glucosidase